LIIGSTAETEEFLGIFGFVAFLTNEIGHFLRLVLSDAHAITMEPVVAQVTSNVKSNEKN
jgi:hypothetical protein